jgi:hypothetical protein
MAATWAGWIGQKRLGAAVFWDYMRPIRKVAGIPFLPVTVPAKVAGKLAYAGLAHGVNAAEWTAHATREVAKGIFQGTVKPAAMITKSRTLTRFGRYSYNVPIASVKAGVKTPLALLAAPWRTVLGVRDAIFGNKDRNVNSVFRNSWEIVKDLALFRGNVVSNTRKAISDAFSPVTRPGKPIFDPLIELAGAIGGAEGQTFTTLGKIANETMPDAINTIRYAGATASAELAAGQAERASKRAEAQKEKEERQAAWKQKIDEEKGIPMAPAANDNASKMKKAG